MNKEEIYYVDRINILIDKLKNGHYISLNTQHYTSRELLLDIKDYIAYNMKASDKVYVDILINLANSKNHKNCVFSFDASLQKDRQSYVDLIERIIREYKFDKKTAIKIAVNSQESRNKFTDAYKRFNNHFINAILYKDILDDVLKEVNSQVKIVDKRTTYIDSKALKASNRSIYEDVYDSGLSLLDYAHTHYVDSFMHKGFLRPDNAGFDSQKSKELMARKDTCLNVLLEIINKINNNEMDILDYYKFTKLNPVFLKNVAKEHNLVTVTLSQFASANGNPHSEERKVDSQMEAKLVIGSEVVSEEIKQSAKQYMVDLGMPITLKYYNKIVRKLIKSK